MKIVYVITSLGMGGAETQVCNLADKLHELGHELTILYLYGEDVVNPRNEGIKVSSLGLTKNPLSLFRTFYKLISKLRALQPDVVHSHMVHANLITRLARVFTKLPVLISSAHNSNEGGKLRMLAYRFTHNLSDLTTNVGQISVDRFIEVKAAPEDGIVSMLNGIDIGFFSPDNFSCIRDELEIDINSKLLIAVGRNSLQKDYPNLLKAVSLVPSDNFHLCIVGYDTGRLYDMAKELGIEHKVSLLGLRHDVDRLLSVADLLIMSSAWEGLPIVIGEAMASGCNIITTDAGGCSEWLTAREHPVPIRNSILLADAINSKLELTDDKWNEIGKENRLHIVENFSINSIVEKWLSFYLNPKITNNSSHKEK